MEQVIHKQPHPPRKFKFLRRNVTLDQNRDKILSKVRIKRVYFKEVHDLAFHLNNIRKLNRKCLKCLSHLKISCGFSSLQTPYGIHLFQTARSLRRFTFIAVMSAKVENTIPYFVRLSNSLQILDLDGSELKVTGLHILMLYRILSTKRNLRIFRRSFEYYNDNKGRVEEEYPIIKRYLARLHKLKEFNYQQSDINQGGFQRVLKQGQSCSPVTDLSLVIDADRLGTYDELGRVLHVETSDVTSQSRDWDGEMESETSGLQETDEETPSLATENSRANVGFDDLGMLEGDNKPMKDEILPFFRFDLFPGLKRLHIMISRSYRFTIGAFVVEGFKELKKLEQMSIVLENRPKGIKHLFEALLYLPPLNRFSMEIPFVKNQESYQLTRFFGNQSELISLALCLTKQTSMQAKYENLDHCLNNIWQYLENKPKLRYLKINSIYSSVESLSNGLRRTQAIDQLKELEIRACDDSILSQTPAFERIQGLCEFITKQRNSLQHLRITLIYVIEVNLLNSLIKTISGLRELTELELRINTEDEEASEASSVSSEASFIEQNKKAKSQFDEVYVHLRRMLQGMQKLTILSLDFNPISETEEAYITESIKVFNILPTIKTLKTVCLKLPFDKDNENAKAAIVSALSQLNNVTSIDVKTSCESKNVAIQKVVTEINQRQSLRCDLMF